MHSPCQSGWCGLKKNSKAEGRGEGGMGEIWNQHWYCYSHLAIKYMKIRHVWMVFMSTSSKFTVLVNQHLFIDPYCSSLATLIWHCKVGSNGQPTLSPSTFYKHHRTICHHLLCQLYHWSSSCWDHSHWAMPTRNQRFLWY